MEDRTQAHYELARALISYEADDLDEALRCVRLAGGLVSDPVAVSRISALETALKRQALTSNAGPAVSRAYQDAVAELR